MAFTSDLSSLPTGIFLMMRFRDTREHGEMTAVLVRVFGEYGLPVVRADWRRDENELWSNVRRCMDTAQYGVAIFEAIHEPQLSPNVSLELGYMLAQDKKCLILRERTIKILPADLVGHLCSEFDSGLIEETLTAAAKTWLCGIGLAKRPRERWLAFVSRGGTCRDPIAKVITEKLVMDKHLDFDLHVKAVALSPPVDREASSGARNAIIDMYGDDLLKDHRTAPMTEALAREADLILVMDQALLAASDLPEDKTFVFKRFFDLDGDVVDPWYETGEPEALRYRRCAAEIEQILRTRVDKAIAFLRAR